jgi:hypothetical protein
MTAAAAAARSATSRNKMFVAAATLNSLMPQRHVKFIAEQLEADLAEQRRRFVECCFAVSRSSSTCRLDDPADPT